MARPKKIGLDYFPHDCNASTDEKLEILETKYPNGAGYAWYFKTLERIYRHGGELVSAAETPKILSRNLAIDGYEILEFALNLNLFDRKAFEERGALTSGAIQTRMKPILETRERMAKKYEKRVSLEETTEETTEETRQSKVKESKEKKNKEEKELVISPELNTPEFIAAWVLWEQHRKEKKKPLTPTSIKQQFEKLGAMGVKRAIAAIKHSVANGWTGIFEEEKREGKNIDSAPKPIVRVVPKYQPVHTERTEDPEAAAQIARDTRAMLTKGKAMEVPA